MPFAVQAALLILFPALVIVAALRDAISFTIPNWISAALIVAFVPAALAMGLPLATIGVNFAVGVAALLVGMGMFAAGWIGGGDAKVFAAAGLWLGWSAALPFVLITGVAGGALALGLLTLRAGWVAPFVANGPSWIGRLARPGENVPYGVAIAVGALLAFPQSSLVQALGGAF